MSLAQVQAFMGDVDGTALEPEQELIERAKSDPDAFGELFRRHRDRMWAVALRTTNDPELAADAVQEAFISAFRRAETFRGQSAVTTAKGPDIATNMTKHPVTKLSSNPISVLPLIGAPPSALRPASIVAEAMCAGKAARKAR